MMSQERDAVDISSNTSSSLVHCIVGYGVCKLHILANIVAHPGVSCLHTMLAYIILNN